MITIINDKKEIDLDVILTQVNVDGVCSSGFNKDLFSEYPKVYSHYRQLCKSFNYDYEKLRGKYQFIKVNDSIRICNLFIQKEDFKIDINAMKKAFKDVLDLSIKNNYKIAIPEYFGYKTNIDKWDEIIDFVEKVSDKYNINIYIIKNKIKNMEEKIMENNQIQQNYEIKEDKKIKKTNSLDKLNDILFNQIQKLSDASDDSEIQQEISKSYAISHMSQRIINNANVYLKVFELSDKKGLKSSDMPDVLKLENE